MSKEGSAGSVAISGLSSSSTRVSCVHLVLLLSSKENNPYLPVYCQGLSSRTEAVKEKNNTDFNTADKAMGNYYAIFQRSDGSS